MEPQNQPNIKKPGLPEAIHPEIGNGIFWENNPHQKGLASVDPSSFLDQYLLEEDERASILQKWGEQNKPQEPEPEGDQLKEMPEIESGPALETPKKRDRKIVATPKPKSPIPDWLEEEKMGIEEEGLSVPEAKAEIPEPEKSQESPTEPISVEGKRVRKAVKRAQKENKRSAREPLEAKTHPLESSLSPFTRWLKSLKGSEYVHPYEDDYGLEQMAAGNKDGISETLANLLASQGFKDRAIDMYRLLMAKYPEKSSFFAAKIEALK